MAELVSDMLAIHQERLPDNGPGVCGYEIASRLPFDDKHHRTNQEQTNFAAICLWETRGPTGGCHGEELGWHQIKYASMQEQDTLWQDRSTR